MRIESSHHRLSIDPGAAWEVDPADPATVESFGFYLRSVAFGFYLNVRSEAAPTHPLTELGLRAHLHDQSWASPPFDEWSLHEGTLTIVGGTFETTGMNGEVVLEVYATEGTHLVNLAGPAPREIIAAGTHAVQQLVKTLRLGDDGARGLPVSTRSG